MDSATFRNDVGKEFCPRDALGHPENGCSWNGPSCGAGVDGGDGLCGPEYYKLFDKTVAAGAGNSSSIVNRPDSRGDGDGGGGGGGSTGQFAFGAQEYSYPASPEAFNATCKLRMQAISLFTLTHPIVFGHEIQNVYVLHSDDAAHTGQRAGWGHEPNHPCQNFSSAGFRDPAEEGQPCINGDCWSFGYNAQMLNLSAMNCAAEVGTHNCARVENRHSVWQVPTAMSWSTTGWRDPNGPPDGPCVHWNMEVGDFPAPSMQMMLNIAWQSVANGANGLVFYSLMDNFRTSCCRGVIPNTAHGCNETLPAKVAEANLQRLESFASQFMKKEELLVGRTVSYGPGSVVSAMLVNKTLGKQPTYRPAWPHVQHIVKEPRGVPSGTNSTPTTLVAVNAVNTTQECVFGVLGADGTTVTNISITVGPQGVQFRPV